MAYRQVVMDDLDQLLEVLPPRIRQTVEQQEGLPGILEIVLDLGRRPEARFPGRYVYLDEEPVTRQDIEHILGRVGEFGADNRAGIERTLHRISAIRNRNGAVVGLTCRIGRAVFGTIDIIRDVVETGRSTLLLGRPGVGKTTMLRELARVLSDEFGKRVVIVDTSNEIAGDGDIPHPGIGHARRMQVPFGRRQADVMIEAVENHMPEVIVIDEIGTEAEAEAARTIAERGVQLIGTAHGNTLDNLIMNPTLCDLVGGIQAVTLGDEEARRRGTQKTVLERKAPPTFDILIEIQEKDRLAIHGDVAKTIDFILRGVEPRPEVRVRKEDGSVEVVQRPDIPVLAAHAPAPGSGVPHGLTSASPAFVPPPPAPSWMETLPRAPADRDREEPDTRPGDDQDGPAGAGRALMVFPYAVSRNKLEYAIENSRVRAKVARDFEGADCILTLKGQYRKMPKRLREAERRGKPIHVIKSNTISQIEGFLRGVSPGARCLETQALTEAEEAIRRLEAHMQPVELRPQNSYVRKLQHQLADKRNVKSFSIGEEPNRRVVFYVE